MPSAASVEVALALIESTQIRPALVAVDGLGGAGKSSLAAAIAERRTDVNVIHGDDFYGPEERDWLDWTPAQGYERYFDHQRLEDELLGPVMRGATAHFQRYDWDRKTLGGWETVDSVGVILLEGVYLLRPRLRPYWDASIFVDAPRSLRHRRLRARGENDAEWIARWMRAEDHYERVAQPRQAADLVIDGSS
ncbi:MAG: hypothetical protein WKF54_14230 [Nocardioidaceae bacterium]